MLVGCHLLSQEKADCTAIFGNRQDFYKLF